MTNELTVFFLFTQVSNALMHVLLELSSCPEAQEKLYKELIECYPNDRVPYDEVNKSEYLSACLDESILFLTFTETLSILV